MDNFKQASRNKVRFVTKKGTLTVEQLWDLSLADLDELAVSLQEEYEKSASKSFLKKRSVKDAGVKLQFDIVVDILETKVEERDEAAEKAKAKAHNEEILALISEKEKDSLKKKSVSQLRGMLR